MGLEQLILSIYTSVTTFVLLPIPLFILMGEVMFHSGIAVHMIDTLDKWLGRLPGRLGLLAVASGTVLSTLTGNSCQVRLSWGQYCRQKWRSGATKRQ